MIKQRKIELLAPAKNLECGIEAINHGADAVYIGAPKFGARAAAVNSLEDIEALVKHAHLYNARIYVTVNTILKEEELQETEEMIHALYRIGVDALIVQDMGITQLNLPPIPLHASTQMDNRTPEKVKFLKDVFSIGCHFFQFFVRFFWFGKFNHFNLVELVQTNQATSITTS